MQFLFRTLGVFMQAPWLVLVPVVVFYALFEKTSSRLALVTTIFWLLYGAYELGMKNRWLCTGECNIRVDLLLIYPVMVILSVTALVAAVNLLRRPKA